MTPGKRALSVNLGDDRETYSAFTLARNGSLFLNGLSPEYADRRDIAVIEHLKWELGRRERETERTIRGEWRKKWENRVRKGRRKGARVLCFPGLQDKNFCSLIWSIHLHPWLLANAETNAWLFTGLILLHMYPWLHPSVWGAHQWAHKPPTNEDVLHYTTVHHQRWTSLFYSLLLKKWAFLFFLQKLMRKLSGTCESNNLNVCPLFSKAKLCSVNAASCFSHFRSVMKQRMSTSMSFSAAIHFSALMTTELLKTACVDLFLESAGT